MGGGCGTQKNKPQAAEPCVGADEATTSRPKEEFRTGVHPVEGGDWPLRAEASRIFSLADKDANGLLDLRELANLRNRPDAQAMMEHVDADVSGTVSESEWLAYVKKIFDKNEKAAAAVLKLYEKQVHSDEVIEMNTTTASPVEPCVGADDATARLKEIFDGMDTNHNGTVDKRELATKLRADNSLEPLLKAAGINSSWYVHEQLDANMDGRVTWEEFRTEVHPVEGGDWPLRAEASRIFSLADKDANGLLNLRELANLRNRSDAQAMMEHVDADVSGTVSESEWLAYVKKIFDKNEKAAAAVLKLYEKQVHSDEVIEMNTTTASPQTGSSG